MGGYLAARMPLISWYLCLKTFIPVVFPIGLPLKQSILCKISITRTGLKCLKKTENYAGIFSVVFIF